MWTIPAVGGEVRPFDLKWDRDIQFLSVQPGGNKIAFQSGSGLDQEEGVWVMQNFLPASAQAGK